MIHLKMMRHRLLRYLGITVGCLLASCSINLFLVPSHLLTGGATGIAIIVYYLAQLPIGLQTFLYNIPLLMAAWKTLGHGYTVDVIIGTGINVNIAEEDFPEDLRDKATSLSQLKGEEIPRVAFFRAVLEHMDALYDSILREGFAEVFSMWRRYSITLGQMVRVIDARGGKDAFTGRAVDIDEDGALLVDTAEGRRRVLAGDVSIRPQQD